MDRPNGPPSNPGTHVQPADRYAGPTLRDRRGQGFRIEDRSRGIAGGLELSGDPNGRWSTADRHDEQFDRWFRMHFVRLTRLCSRILSDRAAAEDVAQETLLLAWSRRETLRDEDVGAWLSVVARNAALSRRRDTREIPLEMVGEAPDAEDLAVRLERQERREFLHRELMQLTPLQRDALRLRDLEGLDHVEVGSGLGLASGAVRAVLFRARRALRTRLESAGDEFLGVCVATHASLSRIRRRMGFGDRVSDSAGLGFWLGSTSAFGLVVAAAVALSPIFTAPLDRALLQNHRSAAEARATSTRHETIHSVNQGGASGPAKERGEYSRLGIIHGTYDDHSSDNHVTVAAPGDDADCPMLDISIKLWKQSGDSQRSPVPSPLGLLLPPHGKCEN